MTEMKRREFLAFAGVGLASGLSGCVSVDLARDKVFTSAYGPINDGGFALPAIPTDKIDRKFHRQIVRYDSREKPGTIIVDTTAKHLYFVNGDGTAMRYGIGVGREGFEWQGTARIAMKREWPVWTPPAEMIKRKPELEKWRQGMPPGIDNPLGARAMYLFNKGGDSGYRLHGTPEWSSIGKAMSSGCIRLINQDVIDLYSRASTGARVLVA